jgi:hypothetical protein
MYKISEYSKNQAMRLGVDIKPSTRKNKKIDVYKDGKYLVSIGDIRYYDYPYYLQEERMGNYPKGTANRNRYLYHKRHAKDSELPESAGFYAKEILW